jgi:hypothetical protein
VQKIEFQPRESLLSMTRLRPRFSLLSAILLMTIVGFSIVTIQLWREVGPLRLEVRQLRDEAGRLSVEAPDKIHAIQLRTHNELAWEWKVWIPEGELVQVKYVWGKIPGSGYPQPLGVASLKAGENRIALIASRNAANDGWFADLKTESPAAGTILHGGQGLRIPDESVWFERDEPATNNFYGEEVGYSTSAESGREQRFLLMRKRVLISDGVPSDDDGSPLPGFLIWLERP